MRIRPDICALPCIGNTAAPFVTVKVTVCSGSTLQTDLPPGHSPYVDRCHSPAHRVTRCHLHRDNLCAGGIATKL